MKLFQRQGVAAVAIVLIALFLAVVLIKIKQPVQKKPVEEYVQQVKIIVLEPQEIYIPVFSQGVVEPRTKIKLLAEANGRVLETSKKWLNGGFFHKGEQLLRIEDYYYKNQLARSQASLAQAKSALIQEEGFAYVAQQDWEKRNTADDNSSAKALALREPQLASMQAQFDAATADVVSAENSLAKTKMTAPFDGVLSNKTADIGQYVSPGVMMGELQAIDTVEIKVPLTEAQQAYINLPSLNQTIKSPATIKYSTPDGVQSWSGYLVRTEGVLDPLTKVLNGVVQVQDPYGLNKKVTTPLRLGTFVEVELQGKKYDSIFVLPRRFLYSNNSMWLVDKDNKLFKKTVKLLPIRDDNIYVYEGLAKGDRLVVDGVVGGLNGTVVNPILIDKETLASELADEE
jgi:RND family efflux transporter MFP subunit